MALPDLGIGRIKAKVDTGARSSAMHAFDIETFQRGGIAMVRFKVHPFQHDSRRTVTVETMLFDERNVRNSGGKLDLRPVIETRIELLGKSWPIELTLTNRDEMGFRMLLGRQAVRRQFVVDPGRSFVGEKKETKCQKKSRKRNVQP